MPASPHVSSATGAAPEVSVVIPTRDRWSYLRRTLSLVLDQRDVDLEVVIVDDGSVEDTPALLSALDDPRLRLIPRAEGRQGLAAARNIGIENARGTWVALLDDDDLWSPLKLRSQLDAGQEADWVYGGSLVVDGGMRLLDVWDASPAQDVAANLRRFNDVPAGSSNVLVRRELFERTGGFFCGLSHLADWDMWLRLARHGRPARSHGHELAYVMHGSNMHVTQADTALAELDVLLARNPEVDVDGAWFTRWLAGGHRANGRSRAAARTYLHGAVRFRSPGNAVRAAGVLAGERVMGLAAGRRPQRALAPAPGWLAEIAGDGAPAVRPAP